MSNVILAITLLICFVMVCFNYIRRTWTRPDFLFSSLWAIILIINLFFETGWYSISIETALIIFCGYVSFVFATYLVPTKKYTSRIIESDDKIGTINYKMTIILGILWLILRAPSALENVALLKQGMSFNQISINKIINGNSGGGSIIRSICTIIFLNPFVYAYFPVFINELFEKKKKNFLIFILGILIILVSILQNGRRSFIFYMIIVGYIFVFKNVKEKVSLSLGQKVIVVLCVGVAILGVTWLSEKRDTNFWNTIITYIGACVPALDQRIKYIDSYYYGLSMLHGLLVPLMIGLNGVFKLKYPSWWLELDALVEAANYVQIGTKSSINAFNSIFYIPYIDGGIVFVIIEMLILGYVSGLFYRKYKYRGNKRDIFVYSVLCISILCSMYTFYITQYPYILSFVYLVFITKERNT